MSGQSARSQVRLAEEIPAGLSEVGQFDTLRKANEHALVVLAMDRPYWIFKIEGCFHLCVRTADAVAVCCQMRLSEAENRNWPPRHATHVPEAPSSWPSLWVFAGLLLGFFTLQRIDLVYWRDLGLMDNLEVFRSGEGWRTATALTLHGDVGHLAGNLLAGVCFGLLLNRIFGYGLGWSLVLLGGITGNLINGWFYLPELHRSLGASTAVFAALGTLVGHGIRLGFSDEGRALFKRRLLPLAAGLMMLAFTGFGGENTDITAHIFGFAVGVPVGACATAYTRRGLPGPKAQFALGMGTCLLLAAAWCWAVAG